MGRLLTVHVVHRLVSVHILEQRWFYQEAQWFQPTSSLHNRAFSDRWEWPSPEQKPERWRVEGPGGPGSASFCNHLKVKALSCSVLTWAIFGSVFDGFVRPPPVGWNHWVICQGLMTVIHFQLGAFRSPDLIPSGCLDETVAQSSLSMPFWTSVFKDLMLSDDTHLLAINP